MTREMTGVVLACLLAAAVGTVAASAQTAADRGDTEGRLRVVLARQKMTA